MKVKLLRSIIVAGATASTTAKYGNAGEVIYFDNKAVARELIAHGSATADLGKQKEDK